MVAPLWSPRGDVVAYGCGPSGLAVCLASAEGGSPPTLVAGYAATALTWAPDGSRLAFIGSRDTAPQTPGLYTVAPDGTGLRLLAGDVTGQGLAWSPNGKLLAFAGDRVGTVPATGGPVTVLASGAGAESVAWSPSGARIAYCSSGFLGGTAGVYTMASDGTDRGRVDDRALESPWKVAYRPR
jgi:Tol biopolymer transport system component